MAKLGNLGQYTTPLGTKGNIFDVGSWLSMILGVMVFLATLAIGQRVAKTVEDASGGRIDTSPGPIIDRPSSQPAQKSFRTV